MIFVFEYFFELIFDFECFFEYFFCYFRASAPFMVEEEELRGEGERMGEKSQNGTRLDVPATRKSSVPSFEGFNREATFRRLRSRAEKTIRQEI